MKPHWHHKKISGVPLLGPGRGKFHLGKQEIIPSNWLSLRGKVKVDKSLKFVCFWLGKICFVEVESMKVFKFLPQKNWRWIKVSILKFWVSSFKSVFSPVEALLSNWAFLSPSFRGDPGQHHISPDFGGQKNNEKKTTKCQMSLRKTNL